MAPHFCTPGHCGFVWSLCWWPRVAGGWGGELEEWSLWITSCLPKMPWGTWTSHGKSLLCVPNLSHWPLKSYLTRDQRRPCPNTVQKETGSFWRLETSWSRWRTLSPRGVLAQGQPMLEQGHTRGHCRPSMFEARPEMQRKRAAETFNHRAAEMVKQTARERNYHTCYLSFLPSLPPQHKELWWTEHNAWQK